MAQNVKILYLTGKPVHEYSAGSFRLFQCDDNTEHLEEYIDDDTYGTISVSISPCHLFDQDELNADDDVFYGYVMPIGWWHEHYNFEEEI